MEIIYRLEYNNINEKILKYTMKIGETFDIIIVNCHNNSIIIQIIIMISDHIYWTAFIASLPEARSDEEQDIQFKIFNGIFNKTLYLKLFAL
jgi:hypothetical protein